MILPTKRVDEDRALITLAAKVLENLDESKTVSRLWDEIGQNRQKAGSITLVTYDWFVLSLDLLFALGAINFENGRLGRVTR